MQIGVAVVAASLAAVVAGAAPAESAKAPPRPPTITVMTRNLYLGAGLDPIVKAKSVPEALQAVERAWALVQANDFRSRARAITAEIARARPEFVGLQELVLYRTQTPSDFLATPARTVVIDYAAELRRALALRRLPYRFVAIKPTTDAELPSGFPPTMDIRLTVRDAMLVRRDRAIRIRRVTTGLYRTTTPLFGGLVTARRGWIAVDASVRGRTFRVITTHLESFSDPVQVEQGKELLRGPAATRLPVVLVGDLNSRADGSGTPTRANFLGAGFRDAWLDAYPRRPGLTCCHGEDLREPGGPFYSRIDYVLARSGFRGLRGAVVGEQPASRTANGLWPSDHAGVWLTLRLPGR